MTATLAVIAKAPVPGRVKTRLCPPCTLSEAAQLAEASLRDVVGALLATPADRRVIVLDGDAPWWLPPQLEVVRQRGDGLDERLARAFADLGRALIVSMDTPQVRPADLVAGLRALHRHDAVVGPAADGGFWAIGLRRPDPRALVGVPMGDARTLAAQRRRLDALGLRRTELRELRDVDTWDDAVAAAKRCSWAYGRVITASGGWSWVSRRTPSPVGASAGGKEASKARTHGRLAREAGRAWAQDDQRRRGGWPSRAGERRRYGDSLSRERHGARSTEGAGQLGEDRKVGVQPDAIQTYGRGEAKRPLASETLLSVSPRLTLAWTRGRLGHRLPRKRRRTTWPRGCGACSGSTGGGSTNARSR